MQIVYASVTLASAPPTDAVPRNSVGTRQANQVSAVLRAANPTVSQRGNRTKAIEFVVERTFSTQLDADKFVHDHEGTLPTSGSLVYTLSDGSTTRTYAGAVLESVTPEQHGMAVTVSYVFTATTVA